MGALLWAEGNRAAAVHLEELWNDLGKTHAFSLCCAYPMQGFDREMYEEEFTEICQQHSRDSPAESYTPRSSAEEPPAPITLWRPKATSPDAQIDGAKEMK